MFQQLDPLSPGIAQQIRAYFYLTQNFNAFYGGYGVSEVVGGIGMGAA